jgi:hypothetical protein
MVWLDGCGCGGVEAVDGKKFPSRQVSVTPGGTLVSKPNTHIRARYLPINQSMIIKLQVEPANIDDY